MLMIPDERLQHLHDMAMLNARTKRLRLRELRLWLLIEADIAERRRIEAEIEKDLEDYNSGNASGDWTK